MIIQFLLLLEIIFQEQWNLQENLLKKEELDRYDRFAREMKMGGKGKDSSGQNIDFKWPTLEKKEEKKKKKKFLILIYMGSNKKISL